MFSSSTFLSFLVLALVSTTTTNATPIQQHGQSPVLGIAAKINASGSKNLADIDRARLAALIARVKGGNYRTHGKRADGTVVATDTGVSYTANVGVGIPPTYCKPFRTLTPRIFRHLKQIPYSLTPAALTLGSGPINHTSRPKLRKIPITMSLLAMAVGTSLEKYTRIP